jgi:hypothetical protein
MAKEQYGLPGSWIHKKMTKRNKDGQNAMSYWAYKIELNVSQTELKIE